MVSATRLDGINDYLLRGADLTGLSDGKAGLFSAWIKFNGGDGERQTFVANTTTRVRIERLAANTIKFDLRNSTGTSLGTWASVGTYTTADGWIHILSAWDLATGTSQLYVNDTSDHNETVNTDAAIDYTRVDHGIGALVVGTGLLNGCFSELYINYAETLDISVEANRRKFITADLKAVNLNPDGSRPTGTAPIIYLPNPFDSFEQNAGTGGDFTVAGSLEACADAPVASGALNVGLNANIIEIVVGSKYTFDVEQRRRIQGVTKH